MNQRKLLSKSEIIVEEYYTPHEHRNLTSSPCPICKALPNINHEVSCPCYGVWDTEYIAKPSSS